MDKTKDTKQKQDVKGIGNKKESPENDCMISRRMHLVICWTRTKQYTCGGANHNVETL